MGRLAGFNEAMGRPPASCEGVRNLFPDFASLFSGNLILWGALWVAIDTGPWNLSRVTGWVSIIDALRAALPLGTLVFVLLWWALHLQKSRIPTLAEGGFWGYGFLMLLMSVGVTHWFTWGYWGLAFLAVLAVTYVTLSEKEPLEAARRLNWSSWLLATLALVVMLVYARDKLFVGSSLSAYSISNRASPFLGAAISRSTGLSRLAAVPAILGFLYVLKGRGWVRLVSAVVFLLAIGVIWVMQSRGSLFSFLGAFSFLLLFGGRKARRCGILLGLASVVLIVLDLGLGGRLLLAIWEHATRDTGLKGFQTMSGRPRIWRHAFRYIDRSPWLGYGPQADRRLGIGDAQNLVVYGLLATGIVGTTALLLGFGAAGYAFLRVLGKRQWLPPEDQILVIATGAVLVFLALRSIPEDGASYFSVDLLLQMPAMAYLALLARKLHRRSPVPWNETHVSMENGEGLA